MVHKDDLERFMSIHNEARILIKQGMYKYNDVYIHSLVKMYKSIKLLKELPVDTIKSLIFCMRQRKVKAGTTILRFKEY